MALPQRTSSASILLSDREPMALENLALHHRGHAFQARQAQIILSGTEGRGAANIRPMRGCTGQTVTAWRWVVLKTRSVRHGCRLALIRYYLPPFPSNSPTLAAKSHRSSSLSPGHDWAFPPSQPHRFN